MKLDSEGRWKGGGREDRGLTTVGVYKGGNSKERGQVSRPLRNVARPKHESGWMGGGLGIEIGNRVKKIMTRGKTV